MGFLIGFPWLAFAAAAAIIVLNFYRPARGAFVCAILWVLYGFYEYGMKMRVLCSGECNIRIDLLAIYPLLLILTFIVVRRSLRG